MARNSKLTDEERIAAVQEYLYGNNAEKIIMSKNI